MLRVLYKVTTGLILALGLLHIALTRFNYDRFDMDAMWFVGSGVAIVLAGLLNIAEIRNAGRDRLILGLSVAENLIFVVLFGIGAVMLSQPQVFLGLVLFIIAIVLMLFNSSRHT